MCVKYLLNSYWYFLLDYKMYTLNIPRSFHIFPRPHQHSQIRCALWHFQVIFHLNNFLNCGLSIFLMSCSVFSSSGYLLVSVLNLLRQLQYLSLSIEFFSYYFFFFISFTELKFMWNKCPHFKHAIWAPTNVCICITSTTIWIIHFHHSKKDTPCPLRSITSLAPQPPATTNLYVVTLVWPFLGLGKANNNCFFSHRKCCCFLARKSI